MINTCKIEKALVQQDGRNLKDRTIGELVAEDFRSAAIFRNFNIDYCCGGKKSLGEVCATKGLELSIIQQALQKTGSLESGFGPDMNCWELDFLADYILNIHHRYVKRTMPMIVELANKVANAHGTKHPELIEIQQHVKALARDLEMHMYKEEQILFPYIKSIVLLFREGKAIESSNFESLSHPIEMLELEHETTGGQLSAINQLTQGYLIPEGACSSYRVFYSMLQEFELDLHQHVHLENNILFSKALTLEIHLVH